MHNALLTQTYKAQAFLGQGKEQTKIQGELSFSPMGLRFVSEGNEVTLPFSGMEVVFGGAADKLIFFSHSQYPTWRIFVRDRHILKTPALERLPQVQELLNRRHRRWFLAALLVGTCVFGLLVAGLYFFQMKDSFVGSLAKRIPAEWEEKLGETVYEQMQVKHRFIKNEELNNTLDKMIQPLINSIDSQRYQFKFFILDEGSLNAFAIPGGYIFIHSGLLLKADSVEEALGVVAHELAHITQMHGMRKLIETAGVMIVAQALVGDIGGLLGALASNAPLLLNQKFSRDLERDADDEGWEYIHKAHIDPRGMLTFFEKMQAEEKKAKANEDLAKVDGLLEFFSTHPATQERIKVLKTKIAGLSIDRSYISFDLNFDAFKHNVQQEQRSEEDTEHAE